MPIVVVEQNAQDDDELWKISPAVTGKLSKIIYNLHNQFTHLNSKINIIMNECRIPRRPKGDQSC